MRTYDEYKRILTLWEQGETKKGISRETGIPRRTVIDCIQRYESLEGLDELFPTNVFTQRTQKVRELIVDLKNLTDGDFSRLHATYAYLFGLYLGDGDITKVRNVYRLRVSLDYRYPGIIASCKEAMQCIAPDNSVGQVIDHYKGKPSCVKVYMMSKYIPDLFPQHGEGRKHERSIDIEDWQLNIVQQHPLEFWRGLYHSDGSRFDNVVNGKAYPRYQFTNTSQDIIRLFCMTTSQLGLHWTYKARRNPKGAIQTDVFISKRKDVEFLDQHIGPKA